MRERASPSRRPGHHRPEGRGKSLGAPWPACCGAASWGPPTRTCVRLGRHRPGPASRKPRQPLSPEEEAQGAHVSQVHAEHAADLLQGACALRLVPARRLQEATAVREPQVGVGAGGGPGEWAGYWPHVSVRAERGGRHVHTRVGLRHMFTDTPSTRARSRFPRNPRMHERARNG